MENFSIPELINFYWDNN